MKKKKKKKQTVKIYEDKMPTLFVSYLQYNYVLSLTVILLEPFQKSSRILLEQPKYTQDTDFFSFFIFFFFSFLLFLLCFSPCTYSSSRTIFSFRFSPFSFFHNILLLPTQTIPQIVLLLSTRPSKISLCHQMIAAAAQVTREPYYP